MEELQRLAGVVSRVLGIPAETVADYAKSEEASKDLSKAFKDFRTKVDSDGYTRAEGKVKGDVEKALKKAGIEKPDFDALTDGLDQLKSSAASGGGSQASDEDALKHPAVKRRLTELENEKMQAVNAARKEGEAELTEKQKAFQKEQQDARVEAAARTEIAALNPNLNPDSAKAQKQLARLLADIKAGEFKLDGDKLLPVDKDGKLLENGSGGSKSFAEYVREVVTSEYDLPAAKKREMPEAGDTNHQAGAYKGPKTQAEYETQLNAASPTERPKLIADFKAYKESLAAA